MRGGDHLYLSRRQARLPTLSRSIPGSPCQHRTWPALRLFREHAGAAPPEFRARLLRRTPEDSSHSPVRNNELGPGAPGFQSLMDLTAPRLGPHAVRPVPAGIDTPETRALYSQHVQIDRSTTRLFPPLEMNRSGAPLLVGTPSELPWMRNPLNADAKTDAPVKTTKPSGLAGKQGET